MDQANKENYLKFYKGKIDRFLQKAGREEIRDSAIY